MIHVRPYIPADRAFVLGLAPRLAIGMPSWRDADAWRATVVGWIEGSIARHGQGGMVFVAEDEDGQSLGFATVSEERHFTGEPQATVGELATSADAEGRGAGAALMEACEAWARERGFRLLSLATGAANERALGFYRGRGYLDEDVKLIKLL